MLTFIKLGGSLITDKTVEASYRAEVVARLAEELADALQVNERLQLLVGHGSGAFGHFAAAKYGTMRGVHSLAEWRGFAEVATTAAELNYRVAGSLRHAGLPVWRIQPSASARCHDRELVEMAVYPLRIALAHGLVPLVYGDVSLDDVHGGTIISTEAIMAYLAGYLPVKRILLLGEVAGVHDLDGNIIPEITPDNVAEYERSLGGSAGTDVTGGMLAKVQAMLDLVVSHSGLTIRILDGQQPGLLRDTLLDEAQPGTLIQSV